MYPTDGHYPATTFSSHVRTYISSVYSLLGFLFLTFISGIVIGIHGSFSPDVLVSLSFFGSILTILAMGFTTGSRTPHALIVSLLMGFICAPTIEVALYIDETAVLISVIASIIMFFSISVCAHTMPIQNMFYVGSMLFSFLNMSLFIGFVGIFIEAEIYHLLHIWLSLIMFLMFVLYDTQLMVERANANANARSGYKQDYVFDALNLFLDFVNVFIRVLALITDIRKKLRDRD